MSEAKPARKPWQDRSYPGGRHRSIAASHAEWDRWDAARARHGLAMQAWVRFALNRQCDLEEALLNMESTEREKGLLVDRSKPEEE